MTIDKKWEAERRLLEKAFTNTSLYFLTAVNSGNEKEAERQEFELYQVVADLRELAGRKEH